MAELRLVAPSTRHRGQFEEALAEFAAEGKEKYLMPFGREFTDYVRKAAQYRSGERLPDDIVPSSEFFGFLDDGSAEGKLVGRISVRHRLNDFLRGTGGHIGYAVRPSMRGMGYASQMLALALKEAARLGIGSALMTAKKDNVASLRVIEKCGGTPTAGPLADTAYYLIPCGK